MSPLVQGEVRRTLLRMAVPMLAGTFAMNANNLVDAWFVSLLGLPSQTAIGFVLPVAMLWSCLGMGLGSGVTALVSHALGQGRRGEAARAGTHAALFLFGLGVAVALLGLALIDPIFRALGADGEELDLIRGFMRAWYLGVPFLFLANMGNGILIAAGDSRAAGRLMMLGPLLNLILNPILIFGPLGLPALGVRGSATATALSSVVAMTCLCAWIAHRHGLLAHGAGALAGFARTIREVLRLGVPGVLSLLLLPVSSAVITRVLAGFGDEPVAAIGIAARVEMFAFIIPMALGMGLMPFVSANHGAGRLDRVREALTLSTRFALLYGAAVALVFFAAAPLLASAFSDDAAVVEVLVTYVRVVSFGYGAMEVHRYCGFTLTGLKRPKSAMALNAVRVLGLLVPCSLLGAELFGVEGVFWGRLLSDLTAGALAMGWAGSALVRLRRAEEPVGAAS